MKKLNVYFNNFNIDNNVLYLNKDYHSDFLGCNISECFAIPINQILGITKTSSTFSTRVDIFTSHFIFKLYGDNLKYCVRNLLFDIFKK